MQLYYCVYALYKYECCVFSCPVVMDNRDKSSVFNICGMDIHENIWPDLLKGVLYMHSFKIYFSSPFDSYINGPTAHVCDTAKSWTVYFYSGLFLQPVWHPTVLGWPLNGPSSLVKQTADCDSPHNWLMSLAADLTALCNMWIWKWHQWMPFGCF